MRANRLKGIWDEGRCASNYWCALPGALGAEIAAHQGWDSILIDMQHGQIGYEAMCAMLVAVSTTDTVPLVRIPWNEPGTAMRALDAGAYGVMCPSIESAEECRRFVGACRYPPLGYRSVGPRRAMLYAGQDYVAKANSTLLAIVQIETRRGLENIDAIAAVEGLDMVFVGPSDLGLSLGRAVQADQTDPVVVAALDAVQAGARRAGVRAGIFCKSLEYAKAMARKGFDLVTVTSDEGLLTAGAALARQFSA
ncbi:MAG: 2,4-dihydroxyhept-2-ene-1,7-dioic acid aldolase [Alphaproteobacteria bacterium]|nr:2,4-dihydroxyhept-2-ene-1,7-dioic acid aldolase [Alphaproteobacteria bacterium]MBV9695213.1 2,4-dihydroxyhept-2-ene-1,7-dioic acid aldolase [Alphaproteobacteria bacterium]